MSKKPPCRWRKRLVPLGILSTPLVVWLAITLIVPTGWARHRIAARLQQATGRPVEIGSIAMGWLGDLSVRDVAIAEPGDVAHPWATIPEARLNVHLGHILLGQCAPSEIRLIRPSLRFARDGRGIWQCGGLVPPAAPGAPRNAAAETEASATATTLVIEDGAVSLDDQTGRFHLELSGVVVRGTIAPGVVMVEDARGMLNGGVVHLAARVERDGHALRFETETRAEGVDLDGGLDGLAHLVPIVEGGGDVIRGTLQVHLTLKGRGRTIDEVLRGLRGDGSFLIDPVDLTDSRFLEALNVLGEWPETEQVGALSSDFTIADGRANSRDLTLRVGRFPLVLAGWTDFTGRFDYGVQADQMTSLISREARGWLKEAGVHLDQLDGIRIVGDPNRVEATHKGRPLRGGPDEPGGPGKGRDHDRTQLRDTARRIRDRFFR